MSHTDWKTDPGNNLKAGFENWASITGLVLHFYCVKPFLADLAPSL